MKRITKAAYNDFLDKLYVIFHRMSIQTSELIYDVRFNDNTCLICKPFISEICVSCSSAMSLIELFRESRQYKENLMIISNNDAIYAEHIMSDAEQYVDNLIACIENETAGDLIDKYVAFMNDAKRSIDVLVEDFLSDDTKAAIELMRLHREQIDDFGDDDDATIFS